jgi:hypothetical protein
MRPVFILMFLGLLFYPKLYSQDFVSTKKEPGSFPVSAPSQVTSIYIDDRDDWLVRRSALLLQTDIETVTGQKPAIIGDLHSGAKNIIIIGTMEHSPIVKKLAAGKKLDIKNIKGKWEAFQLQTISNPFPGVDRALVITGSDKRGTAFGVFELSRQIGISPWYWWADVPVKRKTEVYVRKGVYSYRSPDVQYRGIFINDEAPAFSGWAREKFGGLNHLAYEKIFELLLRLKGNYLWPAMWGNAFNDDDTLNPVLADKWGIVMGTSHHEPMLRAQQEWKRYGKGQWNYESNATVLKEFWKTGIRNMRSHESIVTVGMRGDGDEPMTEGTAIGLLERIVGDQRKIIREVTGKPESATPQLWALYKEVQDYYDKGMRVPDDVTLLLCDDNWGNIRKLPKLTERPRSGGYGIYYHFDYVGGPRNYKWINTNNIARVWEQMHLAYEYGASKIWVVNVGDLKPMEFPISFFLDYAWDTKRWNEDNLRDYYTQWADQQFGPEHAKEIGEIIRKYSQYASRRKPELLDENTYSLTGYNEINNVVKDWTDLAEKAEKINKLLPSASKDAFFELILYPVKALANLHQLYAAVAMNRSLASENIVTANQWADKARELYIKDSLLSIQYNKETANGKWDHMMDQTHIGYTYWQQPPFNQMPVVKYIDPENAKPEKQAGLKDVAVAIVPDSIKGNVFCEEEGYVSMQAQNWTRAIDSKKIKWKIIPDIGRDGSGITSFPVTSSMQLSSNSPHVEYDFFTYEAGKLHLNLYFSPTLNFHNDEGSKYAVSIDDEEPQIISLNKEDSDLKTWESWVANNMIVRSSAHTIAISGKHTLKYWMVSPAVVLQKLVVDLGGMKSSYLGPPETKK